MRLSCVTISGSSSDVKDILFSIHLPITASLSLSLCLSAAVFSTEWFSSDQSEGWSIFSQCSQDSLLDPVTLVQASWFAQLSSHCVSFFCQSTLGRPWTCLLQWAASSCHSPCLNPQDALDSSMVIIPPVSSQPPLLTTLEQLSDNPFVM